MVSKAVYTFLIICILLVCLMTYLDFLGFVPIRDAMLNRLEKVPSIQKQVQAYKLGTLGQEAIFTKQREYDLKLKEVEQRQIELDERSLALDAKERELEKLNTEVNQAREELEKTKAEIEAEREGIKALQWLASIYSSMKSREAAAVLQELNPDFTALILAHMDKKAIASIVAAMDPGYAGEITRILSNMDASQGVSNF